MEEYENPLKQIFAEAAAAQELSKIELNERVRKAYGLFDKLDQESLEVLDDILAAVIGSNDPKAIANFWRGYLTGKLQQRFGVQPFETVNEADLNALLDGD